MSSVRGEATVGAALVDALAAPSSVIVVGASSDPAKPSGRPLDYLRRYGYDGLVRVVNPRHALVGGYPSVASIDDLPSGTYDAAVVNLPAPAVTPALASLDRIGVRSAVVIGSGFEDAASTARRDLMAFLATPRRRIRVVGPNCVGTMSVSRGAHLTFSSVLRESAPRPGSVALVTQSGATGNGLLMSLLRRGVGVGQWFSTGDELDVGSLELVAGLLPRAEVEAVGLFLEGVTDLDRLPEVAAAITATGKRVFVVKIADSDLGQIAAGGHTGRVVGSSDISRAVLAGAGLVQVDTVSELADCLVTLQVLGSLPEPASLAAVSVSGAGAVMVADRVQAEPSLRMQPIAEAAAARVASVVGGRVPVANPMDVPFLGETATFAGVVCALGEDAAVDVVLAIESSLAHDRATLAALLRARSDAAAPVVLTHLCEDDPIPAETVEKLAAARVAVVPTPERAARAIARLAQRGHGPGLAAPRTTPPEQAGSVLGLDEVAALLPARFPWTPWVGVADVAGVLRSAEAFGLPVALKAAGSVISHRTELGAVEVVRDADALPAAYARVAAVCAAHGDAVVVQQGAPPGEEILVAAIRDPEYGPAAVLRAGGVLAELLDEQVVVWGGWTSRRRIEVVSRSRLGTLLGGFRGREPGDLAALDDVVAMVLASLTEHRLDFVELNPVVVTGDGVHAIDVVATRRPVGGTAG